MTKTVDIIARANSRDLKEYVDDNSVSLIVTSPRYNVGMPYEKITPLKEYLDELDGIWKECWRCLKTGGRLVINVADTCRRPYIPLHCYITMRLIRQKWYMRGIINWDKGDSCNLSTAWGSWMSPSNPYLNDQVEYIIVCSKTNTRLEGMTKPDITRDEFLKYRQNSWKMDTESAKKVGHPAPFPVELPWRAVKFYTYPGDIVMDPCNGSGTTCEAAVRLGRHYLGFDICQEYVDLANDRLAKFKRNNIF